MLAKCRRFWNACCAREHFKQPLLFVERHRLDFLDDLFGDRHSNIIADSPEANSEETRLKVEKRKGGALVWCLWGHRNSGEFRYRVLVRRSLRQLGSAGVAGPTSSTGCVKR